MDELHLKCCFTLKLASDALSNSQAICLEQQIWGEGRLETQIREYRNQEYYFLSLGVGSQLAHVTELFPLRDQKA